jgi:dTMP kinase
LDRTLKKTDRLSVEGVAFHVAVREGFLSVADAEPDRFVVIDASKGQDEVLLLALDAIDARRKDHSGD